MIGPDPLLHIHVAEQRPSYRITAALPRSIPGPNAGNHAGDHAATNFSSLLAA
jgi:hypothetical protein